MVAGGRFRADLLDRLREGGVIFLPPLRERKDDIPHLIERFVRDAESVNKVCVHREISDQAMDELIGYHWPGNVRELKHCITNAVNAFPHNDLLVPIHIQLFKRDVVFQAVEGELRGPERFEEDSYSVGTEIGGDGFDFKRLIEWMERFSFEELPLAELRGGLETVTDAYAKLVFRLLEAGFALNMKSSESSPYGEPLVHPTMKLLAGDDKLTATQAKRLLKKLLNISPDKIGAMSEGSAARKAYAKFYGPLKKEGKE